ncbi:Endocuticle structural glycoprotein SgAbd-9 [Frankliniella fusca]|uniref:Endocuticle structural glycoprotein SgAbd-9 n=1 Tax=Frankliniella fusca TaxID=407009 RepID=A0AAE1H7T6_9NEOP|nr:Endocuticle structural glycoprotein SgAbd-9 [Frankliniella fusca]
MEPAHLVLVVLAAVFAAEAVPQFGGPLPPPGSPGAPPGPPGPPGPPPLPGGPFQQGPGPFQQGPGPFQPGPFQQPGPFVPIVQQSFDQAPDGSYRWSYQSADGSAQEATGTVTNPGSPAQSLSVQGSYQYQSPEGPVQVAYVADDYGYQPTGNVVHPAIQRAVAYQVALARAEPPGLYNEAGFPVGPVPPGPGPVPQAGPLGPLPPPGPPGPIRRR